MHILIVVQTNQFCAFEIQNTNPQPLPIKDGEFSLSVKYLDEIGDLFKDYANVESLDDFDFDIINASGKTNCIKSLVKSLLPCKSFQIRSIEMVLPELLLKKNVMNEESAKLISFDNRNYEVSVDDNGIWNTTLCTKEGETLKVEAFTSLFTEGFSINKAKLAKINELEERIVVLEKDNECIRRELAYKDSKIRNIERKRMEENTAKHSATQAALQATLKKNADKERLKSQRQEIRLTGPMIRKMYGDKNNFLGALFVEPVVYLKNDKDSVRKYDPIVHNGSTTFDEQNEKKEYIILAQRDGIFYKGTEWIARRGSSSEVKTSRKWHTGDLVGIIADPKDDEAEIRKYMDEVMRKEAMRDLI